MPVLVPLVKLVGIAGTKDLWPPDFRAMVDALEGDEEGKDTRNTLNVNNKDLWGRIADWCSENEEPELAGGFRWFAKRPDAKLVWEGGYSYGWQFLREPNYTTPGVPYSISAHMNGGAIDRHTVAGFAAQIACAIEKVKEELL